MHDGNTPASELTKDVSSGKHLIAAEPGLRERQKLKRRERILASARVLFNKGGYDTTPIEGIAAAAEVSSATVHNYYRGKWQILIELVDRCDKEIRSDITDIVDRIDSSSTPKNIIDRILLCITKGSLEHLAHHVCRHAIATSITREDVEYGISFSKTHACIIVVSEDAIRALVSYDRLPNSINPDILASVLYKVHHLLFVDMIVEERPNIEKHGRVQSAHLRLICNAMTSLG